LSRQATPIGRGFLRGGLALTAVLLCGVLAPAAWGANGSIAGKVTSAAGGAAIEGVEVCAWSIEPTFDFGCDTTDAAGAYLIPALVPGGYVVEFWPGGLNYMGQYYDGKAFWEEPDEVTVASGLTTTGIDAALERGGEIEGEVVDRESGEPLEGIEVVAFSVSEGEFGGEAVTGPDGRYTIDRVPTGNYKIQFWSGNGLNYVTQYYDDRPSWEEADPIFVKAGSKTIGVDAAMQAGGRIAGVVREAGTGAALWGIEVCALRAATTEFIACSYSEEDGSYELTKLPSDAYRVAFSPDFHEFFPEFPSEDDGYLSQYWNGKATLAEATAIPLVAPASVTGVDASLVRGAPARPAATPPVLPPPLTIARSVHRPRAPKCRKGFRRKRVNGKPRCVRVHRPHRRSG
jgi:hypothetical protein